MPRKLALHAELYAQAIQTTAQTATTGGKLRANISVRASVHSRGCRRSGRRFRRAAQQPLPAMSGGLYGGDRAGGGAMDAGRYDVDEAGPERVWTGRAAAAWLCRT